VVIQSLFDSFEDADKIGSGHNFWKFGEIQASLRSWLKRPRWNLELSVAVSMGEDPIKLNLNTIDWNNPDNTQEKVGGSINFISQAIEDLSYISKALHTGFIEENGLLKALELEINKIQKLGIFNIRFDVTGSPVYMQTQKELVIFRIIQEVLNNCIKHAEATAITVLLNYQSQFVEIELSDNGKGFTRKSTANKSGKGTGLMNIIKRTAYIDGTCQVNSFPGKGTTVHMKIPY
jgi:signal transduction histidine kinase